MNESWEELLGARNLKWADVDAFVRPQQEMPLLDREPLTDETHDDLAGLLAWTESAHAANVDRRIILDYQRLVIRVLLAAKWPCPAPPRVLPGDEYVSGREPEAAES